MRETNLENNSFVGKVKWFSKEKGYGFIIGNNKQEVYVSRSTIFHSGYDTLFKGQDVEYRLRFVKGRPQAANVKVLYCNPEVKYDTEDKSFWIKTGGNKEIMFVRKIVPKLNRKIIVHPMKKNDPTYIDLLDLDRNKEADLKTQETPFFKSSMYGFDPQFTVTFNRKDYIYYKQRFPDSIIYWWVIWKQLYYDYYDSSTKKLKKISVQPMHGVWEVPFARLRDFIESGKTILHHYKRRKNDPINAQDSYLFDLNTFKRIL